MRFAFISTCLFFGLISGGLGLPLNVSPHNNLKEVSGVYQYTIQDKSTLRARNNLEIKITYPEVLVHTKKFPILFSAIRSVVKEYRIALGVSIPQNLLRWNFEHKTSSTSESPKMENGWVTVEMRGPEPCQLKPKEHCTMLIYLPNIPNSGTTSVAPPPKKDVVIRNVFIKNGKGEYIWTMWDPLVPRPSSIGT
ncbi:hypothetical protein BDP27DRAFT_1419219 [Rhodocollybia butyracea]|uniref:Uncharacterized protein n=1 Tax=Rhodocollybia butyracea TaxID=206335 RepID=A0A9P5U9M6_9AGAR|nr:hypothetical protein BDP27DRAFT_1419219 [Rhodocollybia butyracea]